MRYASAYYVAEPTEIYMFIDEEPSDLPETAMLIVETKDQDELMSAVEPYFILGGRRE